MSELQQRSRSIRRRVVVVLHALMLLLMGVPAAAGGDIDPTYGEGGTSPAFAPGFTAEAALQPDGKLVMVGHYGTCLPSYSCSLVVARLTAEGLPDPSFGSNGRILWGGNAMGTSVVIQDDGKIVVGGAIPDGLRGLLLRLMPNGDVDDTFGLQGHVEDPLAPIMDVEVLEDGKILAQRSYLGLSRHNSDGTHDISFGRGGFTDPGLRTAWVRRSDGPLGSGGFAGAGTCLTVCGSGALQVLDDGSILIAEGRPNGELDGAVMTIARFEPDGSVARSFGTSGTAEASFDGDAFAYDLDRLDDGALLVSGPVIRSGGFDVGMALFTPTGELDSSFGNGGTVQTDRFPDELIMTATVLQDRSIVVGGTASLGRMRPLLIRYGRDGAPLSEFGDAGFMTIPAPIDMIHDVFVLDDQLLLVGSRFRATRVDWAARPQEPVCSIVGTEEHDVLRGTPADDVICGLGGNDVLIGNGGADVLVGGAGDDHLHTRDSVADDVAQGGDGRDHCNADEEDVIDSCP